MNDIVKKIPVEAVRQAFDVFSKTYFNFFTYVFNDKEETDIDDIVLQWAEILASYQEEDIVQAAMLAAGSEESPPNTAILKRYCEVARGERLRNLYYSNRLPKPKAKGFVNKKKGQKHIKYILKDLMNKSKEG